MRTYVLSADSYSGSIKLLKRLRSKGARLHKVLIIVSIDDHRKIQGYVVKGQKAIVILVK